MNTYTLQNALDALSRQGCNPTKSGSGYTAFCPVHEADNQGHNQSLSIAAGEKAPFVVHCHAGCDHKSIMDALGLTQQAAPKVKRKIVATYDYHAADGQLVSQKLRYEPKDFRQRWPDGKGGWIWKRAECPTPPPNVLYHLPDLLAAKEAGRLICLVEGEKDADRLALAELTVTTTIEGASKDTQRPKWKKDYTDQLSGAARVALIPDNDDAGRAHMANIAEQLRGKVADLRWVELPDLPPKGDVSDWLNQGHTIEELQTLIDAAPDIPAISRCNDSMDEGYWEELLKENSHAHVGNNIKEPSYPSYPSYPVQIQIHQSVIVNQRSVISVILPALEDFDDKGKPLLIESAVATRLAECLKNHFAFCRQTLRWYAFTETHWEGLTAPILDEVVTQLLYAGAPHGFKARTLLAIISLMTKGLLSLPDTAAADTRQIPFTNGLLDPLTRILTPITPDNALTWCLPYAFDPDADCPTIKAWLRQAVTVDDPEDDDNPDDLVEFIRAWLAALLTGRADLQRFLHLLGPGGTGKSTFIRLAEALVGQRNATITDLRNLETNRFETAALYGKRLAAVTDSGKYGGSIDVFKAMTGQDPLRLEIKHRQQGATFIFDGLVLIASNEPLQFTDYTGAVERRRLTIEFSRRITEDERAHWDSQGGEAAVLHREIPGVVNWVLALSRDDVTRLIKDQPPQMTRLNREAMQYSNPVADWLLQCVVPDPNCALTIGGYEEVTVSTRTGEGETESRKVIERADSCAYPNYRGWCLKRHRAPVSTRRFSGLVLDIAKTLGASVYKSKNMYGAYIKGLRLRYEDETTQDPWRGSADMTDQCRNMTGHDGSKMKKSKSKTESYDDNADNDDKTPTNFSYMREGEQKNNSSSPLAQTIIATLTGSLMTRADLERTVSHAHGKAGPAMIKATIDNLLLSGAIAPQGNKLGAVEVRS